MSAPKLDSSTAAEYGQNHTLPSFAKQPLHSANPGSDVILKKSPSNP